MEHVLARSTKSETGDQRKADADCSERHKPVRRRRASNLRALCPIAKAPFSHYTELTRAKSFFGARRIANDFCNDNDWRTTSFDASEGVRNLKFKLPADLMDD